mmetsp:Transcript_9696/g.14522  ORF Transcript_9696/g.14522 Transcript_9696/m.14522 type:complete len:350 (+) Transcript_9696:61-1110(+)|eukprot:CAMPEP_0167753472 /NCGR_PEP_ID=MMETSP0110_2-20121227/7733_1 /TAXON_ID=629695 /ORGANISM="Gymnochlora sp., Strain CCMP2014" /LENGTH=349 /DNA_ID=CAMNT_0007639243 /DNA_START=33 /DNA_END=1082 /DNA_ORIENTATION=-
MAASIVIFIILIQVGVSYIAGQKSMGYAAKHQLTIGFFATVVVCMVAYDIAVMDPSYYDILGVSPHVNDRTLKKAYKSLSKKLHPDKNPDDPEAAENFMLMQEVYEILSKKDLRETYDSYGQDYMVNARISPRSHSVDLSYERLLMYHAPFYFISALVAFALTISKKSNAARSYAFVMLFGLMIIEWYSKTYHESISYFPLTVYQQIECLKNIYHYLLQGAIMYAGMVYQDVEEAKLFLLSNLHKQFKEQQLRLHKQEIMLRLLIKEVLKKPADSAVAQESKEGGQKVLSSAGDELSNLPAAERKKALERKREQQAAAALEKAKAKQSKEHPWGLYIFVALSLLNYFSK